MLAATIKHQKYVDVYLKKQKHKSILFNLYCNSYFSSWKQLAKHTNMHG